ncbi:uncharacterized protein [Dermacentor andersoni]|uniref:uncharacterized protein isoform X2 n=1 Tax=Dermacentor andersoni TaxID=34620 RepID=UPI002415C6D0|nr:uncharacterized protein LOC129385445 isoform X2 [Dermacentor andersoni]
MHYQRFYNDDDAKSRPATTGRDLPAGSPPVIDTGAVPAAGTSGHPASAPWVVSDALAACPGRLDVAPSAAASGAPGQRAVQQGYPQNTPLPTPNAADNIAPPPARRSHTAGPAVPNFQSGSVARCRLDGPSATVRNTRPGWLMCLSVVLAMACTVLGALVYVVMRMHQDQRRIGPRAVPDIPATELDD